MIYTPELREREANQDEQRTDDLNELLHRKPPQRKSSASSLLAGYGAHSSSGDDETPSTPASLTEIC